MKHSDNTAGACGNGMLNLATALMWAFPLLLIVPCVVLDITEIQYSVPVKTVNILLPAGLWLLLMSVWSNVGRTAVLLLPVAVLCAFQIVLLFLYGESIIAVDMFLNVATTNVNEVSELLLNLGAAIVVVCLLYLPPVVVGGFLWYGGCRVDIRRRRPVLFTGAAVFAAGLLCAAVAACSPAGFRPCRTLFPVNVLSNIVTATHRTMLTESYKEASDGFRFNASDGRPDSGREIYLLVIGETSRADNWQLNGYERSTNPRLSARAGLVSCTKAMSESNTTHKSVPLLMSNLDSQCFGDSIYRSKGVIAAFDEAGYSTAWLSNQQRNGALIDFFGQEADTVCFLNDDGKMHYDMELCAPLASIIDSNKQGKLFVVLHTYGSHFNYMERYPAQYNVFVPDNSAEASPENRDALVNAYDNSVLYTDAVLDSLISIAGNAGCPAALVYLADHGEDIFDDSRKRFLHASPTPTYWQLHVPVLVWMSDGYRARYPQKYAAAVVNSGKNVSSSRSAFHTLMSLAGVDAPCYNPEAAVTETAYAEPRRIYLNDYNEAVDFRHSGLRDYDFAQMKARRISL